MSKTITRSQLFTNIKSLIQEAQKSIVRNVNTTMLITYFQIGRMIVEEEQEGKRRAEYADRTIKQLSRDLTKEFGRGYSYTNLEYIRKFYIVYQSRIPQSLIEQFSGNNGDRLIEQFSPNVSSASLVPVEGKAESIKPFLSPFMLSWTHYIQLIKIENEDERHFYEIESIANNWSVRELQRQYNSALYERVALSKDKKGVKEMARKGQIVEKPTDILKSHYVLEFLDLREDNRYSETDLETAIINKLEHFMLELGKGFLFAGRQKRFTFEGDTYFVDLVFYNRLLRCFVLFDLKMGKLLHQDLGQMQMYVNFYDRMIKTADENPTIGIILCKEENKTVVEFTLPEDNNTIFAKEYKYILPSKADLKKQLE